MQVVTTGKMHFGINKGNFGTFQGTKTTSSAYHMPFESSQKGPNTVGPTGQKLASDFYPVNIGQLDHYAVFGTKSGAVEDFQRGKKCPTGVNQTPSRPPDPP